MATATAAAAVTTATAAVAGAAGSTSSSTIVQDRLLPDSAAHQPNHRANIDASSSLSSPESILATDSTLAASTALLPTTTTTTTATTTTTTTLIADSTISTSTLTPRPSPAAAELVEQSKTTPLSLSEPESDPITIVAVAASSSQQQNGDAPLSESDNSEMASHHRPSLPSPHLSTQPPSRPPAFGTSSLPPVSTAYPTGITSQAHSHYSSSYLANPAASASASASAPPTDPHRSNPPSTISNNVTLPSMRTMEAISHQPTPPPRSLNVSLPPVSSAGSPYYQHQSLPSAAPNYSHSQDPMIRYPLPHDPRITSTRGPKKEIKRRTKTGCLTCRKRRIKCDETHPSCNNCKKSKRECLGYDPIFRQQPGGQANPNLQPTPGALSPNQSSILPAGASVPRSTNTYPGQPSLLPNSYTSSPNLQSTAIHTSSPRGLPSSISLPQVNRDQQYNYPPNQEQPPVQSYPAGPVYGSPRSIDSKHLPLPHARSPLRAPVKTMKIDEIINSLGPPAPTHQITHNEETFFEVTKVYHEMYAAGLSSFFETTWFYFVENGKRSFPRDPRLVEQMATFLRILEAVKANDSTQMAYSGVLETRIVWELARTVYQTPEKPLGAMRLSLPADGDAAEARGRLRVVEALLSGEYLQNNPLSPPVADSDQHRTNQFDFWYNLADFVRLRDDPDSAHAIKAREDVMSRMRLVLDGRENRDLLYSIAVARELAPSFGPTYGTNVPQHIDEADPKSRLAVASKFILDESQVTGGTTNIVRRFSDIASRAFVNPGVNVIRKG